MTPSRTDPRIAIGTGIAAIGVALELKAGRLDFLGVLSLVLIVVGLLALVLDLLQQRAQERRERELAAVLAYLPEFLTAARNLRNKGDNLADYVQSLDIQDLEVRRSLLELLEAMTARNRIAASPPPN